MNEQSVRVPAGAVQLEGNLAVPPGANGVVVFAHGSGSSRHSRRNRFVAEVLQRAGLATLLIDLLTGEEEAAEANSQHLRFDIDLLAGRLVFTVDWLAQHSETSTLGAGCFGASTGAAAALMAAAQRPELVGAVVSRGGRPDLAPTALPHVTAPVLLIVGGHDEPVLPLNQLALEQLRCVRELVIVPGATHLFEEPGALAEVARLSAAWFARYLPRAADLPAEPGELDADLSLTATGAEI